MGKKQKKVTQQREFTSTKKKADDASQGDGIAMKSLLDSSVIDQLKAAALSLKQEQEQAKQRQAEAEAKARLEEQKRLENDFAYLLEKSDPRGHKYK